MSVTTSFPSESPEAPLQSPLRGAAANHNAAPRSRLPRTWLVSLTAVCFVFGGLLAAQLRAMQQVRENRASTVAAEAALKQQMVRMRRQFAAATQRSAALQRQLGVMRLRVASGAALTRTQSAQFARQLKEVQLIAGLTPVSGPGVIIILNDNPVAAKAVAGLDLPLGLVHDRDLTNVVNELRAANAEAIAIRGVGDDASIRVTGYTPIRCVGPVVHVNGDPKAPPFRIEAVGDPQRLKTALTFAGGVKDYLSNQGLVVRVERASRLRLPAAERVPHFRVAQPE